MNFNELMQQAMNVRSKYEHLEKEKYGREWTGEELMLGFMKDVGDLAKLVQAKEGVREVANNVDSARSQVAVLGDFLGSDAQR